MKDRVDRSRRIELLIVESLAKIKPTDPKKAAAKKSKLITEIPPVIFWPNHQRLDERARKASAESHRTSDPRCSLKGA